MKKKTMITCDVTDDGMGVPGNRNHCAVANAIMIADPDIVRASADDRVIKFSRRSTGERYTYATPPEAAAFIHEFDRKVAAPGGIGRVRKMTAPPFTLTLTEEQLIAVRPPIDPAKMRQRSIKRAAIPAQPQRRRKAGPRKRPSVRI